MQALFKPTFAKDIKRLPIDVRMKVENICFEIFPAIKSLAEFHYLPLRKMRGFSFYYRIRVGDYRIGFKKTNGEAIFMRVLHRKDIYRFFP